jgi:hypothetical protein
MPSDATSSRSRNWPALRDRLRMLRIDCTTIAIPADNAAIRAAAPISGTSKPGVLAVSRSCVSIIASLDAE